MKIKCKRIFIIFIIIYCDMWLFKIWLMISEVISIFSFAWDRNRKLNVVRRITENITYSFLQNIF